MIDASGAIGGDDLNLSVFDRKTDVGSAVVSAIDPEVVQMTAPVMPSSVGASESMPGLVEAAPTSSSEAFAKLAAFEKPLERERRLPRNFKIGAIVAGVCLLAVVWMGHRTKESDSGKSVDVDSPLVVNEADLRNRKEVSPLDFRPKAKTVISPPTDPVDDLAERKARRANDPDDLIAKKHGARSAPEEPEAENFRRSSVYFDGPALERAGSQAPGGRSRPSLAPAGSIVQVVLTTPIDLQGGSSSAIATVEQPGIFPAKTRLVGSATASDDDRVSFRFARLILPDGREAKIEGEAQDREGHFGILAEVSGRRRATSAGSEWARDSVSAAGDAVLDTVTDNPVGALARRIAHSTPRTFQAPAPTRFSVPAGTVFSVFIHERVSIQD